MLSLTCPVCLQDLTPAVLRWAPDPALVVDEGFKVDGSGFARCLCRRFQIVLHRVSVPVGLFATFRAPSLGLEVWVRLDEHADALRVRRRPGDARFSERVHSPDREALWEALWTAACVEEILSC